VEYVPCVQDAVQFNQNELELVSPSRRCDW